MTFDLFDFKNFTEWAAFIQDAADEQLKPLVDLSVTDPQTYAILQDFLTQTMTQNKWDDDELTRIDLPQKPAGLKRHDGYLRRRLQYKRMRSIQSELMALYNGPGQPSDRNAGNFKLPRHFLCFNCFHFAINPKACSDCKKFFCLVCYTTKTSAKQVITPIHYIEADKVTDVKPCLGQLVEIDSQSQFEYQNSVFFRCIYDCSKIDITFNNLMHHLKHQCPMRPVFCSYRCGDFRLPKRVPQVKATPEYTCEPCMRKTYASFTLSEKGGFGRCFQDLKARQEAATDLKRHSVPEAFLGQLAETFVQLKAEFMDSCEKDEDNLINSLTSLERDQEAALKSKLDDTAWYILKNGGLKLKVEERLVVRKLNFFGDAGKIYFEQPSATLIESGLWSNCDTCPQLARIEAVIGDDVIEAIRLTFRIS